MTMRFLISWVGPFRKAEDDNLGVRIAPRKRISSDPPIALRTSGAIEDNRLPPWQSVQSTRTWLGRQVKAAVS